MGGKKGRWKDIKDQRLVAPANSYIILAHQKQLIVSPARLPPSHDPAAINKTTASFPLLFIYCRKTLAHVCVYRLTKGRIEKKKKDGHVNSLGR